MIIDFLIRLVTPMEGVDYAIAPIVLAGLAQLPGMIKGMSAAKSAKEQAERDEVRARADKMEAQRALSNLRKGKLEFEPLKNKLSSRHTDAYEMAMSRAPEKASREAREQALASALATGGDPRSMAASMQAAAGFAQAGRADALSGLNKRQAATSTLAGLEQSVDETNRGLFRDRFKTELTGAQTLFTASRAQERAARDAQAEAKRQGRQAALSAVTGTLAGAIGMQGVNKFGDIFKPIKSALDTVPLGGYNGTATSINDIVDGYSGSSSTSNLPTSSSVLDDSGNLTGIQDIELEEETGFDNDIFDFQTQTGIMAGTDPSSGGLAKGGKVGKTGGVFDHKTNKKALIDEESGEKEAELTGNETMFVFNPKQTSSFEKLVMGNDAEGLMKFMKKLLKKPQFNK